MAAITPVAWIWVDGKLVSWGQAQDHVLAFSLHYGLGAFEGIRAYRRGDGRTSIFRLGEHLDRLADSCKIATISLPFAKEVLAEACARVVRDNGLAFAYLRPLVYLGYGAMGLGAVDEAPVHTIIAAFDWGAYLGDQGLARGIRAKISQFRRGAVDATVSKAKLCGQYVNSILAKREAVRAGYDEAILLDHAGHVTEASGENVFIVRHGELVTAPTSSSILPGVTRASILRMARDLGYPVRESVFTADELWCADEVFLTGTAAELTPVCEVDARPIGAGLPGPVTRRLQTAFFDEVKGAGPPRYPEWHSFV